MPTPPLVLASTSIYRKTILEKLNLPFISASPNTDETPRQNEKAEDLVLRLAQEKALSIKQSYPNHLVIASDQVATLEAQLPNECTLEEIADLRTGSVMMAVSNGVALLSIQIEESTNVVDWVELTNTTSATIPVGDASKLYYRFKFE